MTRLAPAVLALLLAGCPSRVRLDRGIEFPDVVQYEPGDVTDVVGEPSLLVTGDPAPADGVLLTPEQWDAVRAHVGRLEQALGECYGQVRDDREYCTIRVHANVEALRVCRQGQWRAFGAGVGVGAGACAGADRALDSLSP